MSHCAARYRLLFYFNLLTNKISYLLTGNTSLPDEGPSPET